MSAELAAKLFVAVNLDSQNSGFVVSPLTSRNNLIQGESEKLAFNATSEATLNLARELMGCEFCSSASRCGSKNSNKLQILVSDWNYNHVPTFDAACNSLDFAFSTGQLYEAFCFVNEMTIELDLC